MPVPLLATKLFIPLPVKSLVVRSRLLEKLDESLQPGCRLTLICAPVLATWLIHRNFWEMVMLRV